MSLFSIEEHCAPTNEALDSSEWVIEELMPFKKRRDLAYGEADEVLDEEELAMFRETSQLIEGAGCIAKNSDAPVDCASSSASMTGSGRCRLTTPGSSSTLGTSSNHDAKAFELPQHWPGSRRCHLTTPCSSSALVPASNPDAKAFEQPHHRPRNDRYLSTTPGASRSIATTLNPNAKAFEPLLKNSRYRSAMSGTSSNLATERNPETNSFQLHQLYTENGRYRSTTAGTSPTVVSTLNPNAKPFVMPHHRPEPMHHKAQQPCSSSSENKPAILDGTTMAVACPGEERKIVAHGTASGLPPKQTGKGLLTALYSFFRSLLPNILTENK